MRSTKALFGLVIGADLAPSVFSSRPPEVPLPLAMRPTLPGEVERVHSTEDVPSSLIDSTLLVTHPKRRYR